MPRKKHIVTSTVEISTSCNTIRRFKVMNRIRRAKPNEITCFEHSYAQVAFLSHVVEVFAVTIEFEENITTHGMCCPDVGVNSVGTIIWWGFLVHSRATLDIDKWNGDGAHSWIVELRERLRYGFLRGKDRVVIDRKKDWTASHLRAAISTEGRAPAAFEPDITYRRKLSCHHGLRPVG